MSCLFASLSLSGHAISPAHPRSRRNEKYSAQHADQQRPCICKHFGSRSTDVLSTPASHCLMQRRFPLSSTLPNLLLGSSIKLDPDCVSLHSGAQHVIVADPVKSGVLSASAEACVSAAVLTTSQDVL